MKDMRTKIAFDNRKGIQTQEIPAHVAMNLGQALFEAFQRDMQDPDFRAEFERWKAERKVTA